ncbi:RNA-directed DNA polymerase, eukaryota [Tanacetum coccineum]
MAVFDLNQPASSVSEEDNVFVTNSHVESVSSSGVYSFASHDDNNASSSNSLKTTKDVYHHELIDTPDGSVHWVPRVSASVLPVLGTVYDSLDECIEVYRRYASEAGFGVRLSCQKRLKCGYVKTKYLVCNREGCPKEVWLNTLDPKKNDRQVRSSNFRVRGCKARVQFDMVQKTLKYRLVVFDLEHNHELDRIEYKYLSKAERKLTYNEQLFIIKAANSNIGAVRAHNLYSSLKGSSSLVHGTQTEFKNFTRGVNCFIRDSDAQMLITRFEERQEFTKGFSFDYFIEDAELCGLFWADEVAKCNYIEFGDIVSFDATYKTNKYKMVFVPFTAIDNHRRSVTVGSGLLKRETAEAYGWLLRAFKKAFIHALNIIVTDQDGAMSLAVAAEFPESKHRLCMLCLEFMMKLILKKNLVRSSMFIGPEEFEDKWNKFMEEFNLVNQKWLSKMYRLRSSWIPAFFVDSPLCGLMRTTSSSDEGCKVCTIDEVKVKPVGFPEVIEKENTSKNVDEEINLHQQHTGYYKALDQGFDHTEFEQQKNRYGEKNEAIEKLSMEASIILDSCVHMLRNNEPKLSVFVSQMKEIKSKLEAELPIVPNRTVSDFVEEFMGVKKPNQVKVRNPTGVKPKGREKGKRIKSGREISMKKSNKKKSGCGICGSTSHNRRTCPGKDNPDALYPAVLVSGGNDHADGGSRDGSSGSGSV